MTNEEFQTAVLSELKSLNGRFDNMENRMDRMESQFANLDSRMDRLESRMECLEGQTKENTGIIKALLHRTEELDAKYDNLLNTTATKDSIAKLDTKIDRMGADITFLIRKTAEHEDDIRNLKLIK
ncbi:MAG: trimeric coiled-coil oligomerization domain of matrilin [Firmicutes bacterium]|nr:trimeric coiled-coil oligomerization domain of matrilin [Bacillota bacterium]